MEVLLVVPSVSDARASRLRLIRCRNLTHTCRYLELGQTSASFIQGDLFGHLPIIPPINLRSLVNDLIVARVLFPVECLSWYDLLRLSPRHLAFPLCLHVMCEWREGGPYPARGAISFFAHVESLAPEFIGARLTCEMSAHQ